MEKYYIIFENKMLTSEYKDVFVKLYPQNEIKNLPTDYSPDKYIWNGTEIVINPNYDDILLEQEKADKIALNDELRDVALLKGVTYNNVLFDSDTDQKINLSEQYKRMSDTDTVVWYGMNGGSLLCTKADIQAIGDLIYDLTAFVWGMNDYIKEQIANAETVEEVEAIEINYDRADT